MEGTLFLDLSQLNCNVVNSEFEAFVLHDERWRMEFVYALESKMSQHKLTFRSKTNKWDDDIKIH